MKTGVKGCGMKRVCQDPLPAGQTLGFSSATNPLSCKRAHGAPCLSAKHLRSWADGVWVVQQSLYLCSRPALVLPPAKAFVRLHGAEVHSVPPTCWGVTAWRLVLWQQQGYRPAFLSKGQTQPYLTAHACLHSVSAKNNRWQSDLTHGVTVIW